MTSLRTQNVDRTIRVHTVRASAIRDVVFPFRKLPQPALKIVDRHGNSAGNVTGCVFVRGPRIEDNDMLRPGPFQQFVHRHGFSVRTIAEVLSDKTLQIRQLTLGDRSDRRRQAEDRLVRQAIRDEQAFLPALDQGRLSQRLKML